MHCNSWWHSFGEKLYNFLVNFVKSIPQKFFSTSCIQQHTALLLRFIWNNYTISEKKIHVCEFFVYWDVKCFKGSFYHSFLTYCQKTFKLALFSHVKRFHEITFWQKNIRWIRNKGKIIMFLLQFLLLMSFWILQKKEL